MQNSPEQPRTIWNSTEQHGTTRNSTEQHGTARNSTEQLEHCGEGWFLSRTVAGRMGKRQWADLTCRQDGVLGETAGDAFVSSNSIGLDASGTRPQPLLPAEHVAPGAEAVGEDGRGGRGRRDVHASLTTWNGQFGRDLPGCAPCSLGITAACTGTTDSDKAWQHFVRHAVLKLAQNSNYTNYINDIEGGPPPEGGARRSWTQLDAVGRSRTQSDAVGRSRTQLDAVGRSRTQSDAVGRSWTRLDAVGRGWTQLDTVVQKHAFPRALHALLCGVSVLKRVFTVTVLACPAQSWLHWTIAISHRENLRRSYCSTASALFAYFRSLRCRITKQGHGARGI
eukprot:gene24948-biopygen10476